MSGGQRAFIACDFTDNSPLDLGPCLDQVQARDMEEARAMATALGWVHVRDPRRGSSIGRPADLDFCPDHRDAEAGQ